MPPKRLPPDDPREWLNRARSSLTRARIITPGTYVEDACFDAQQAAEKAVKAVLLNYRVSFPYVHDLARLLTIVEKGGVVVPKKVLQAERLTRFAVQARYPGLSAPVTVKEYRQALRQAETVVKWATTLIQAEGT